MIMTENEQELSEINVTPFIDVMLVLLIIFMVVAPLATASVKVELPAVSSKAEATKKDPIIIYINDKFEYFVGDKSTDKNMLIQVLNLATQNNKDSIIYFNIDKSVPYEILMSVVEMVKTDKYTKIALTTKVQDTK